MPRHRSALGVDDGQLMRRVQSDEIDAFAELYDRHVARAFRVAGAVCPGVSWAEDVVQEGFLSIWRSRSSYRPEAGSFQAWAMRIIQNRAVDSLRRAGPTTRTTQIVDADEADLPDSTASSAEEAVIAAGDADSVRRAVGQLPDAQAQVITLAFFGQLTHTEIARQLDLPSGTVKGRMRLGLKKLQGELQRERVAS